MAIQKNANFQSLFNAIHKFFKNFYQNLGKIKLKKAMTYKLILEFKFFTICEKFLGYDENSKKDKPLIVNLATQHGKHGDTANLAWQVCDANGVVFGRGTSLSFSRCSQFLARLCVNFTRLFAHFIAPFSHLFACKMYFLRYCVF